MQRRPWQRVEASSCCPLLLDHTVLGPLTWTQAHGGNMGTALEQQLSQVPE